MQSATLELQPDCQPSGCAKEIVALYRQLFIAGKTAFDFADLCQKPTRWANMTGFPSPDGGSQIKS